MRESAQERGALRRIRPVPGRTAPSWLRPQPVWPVLVWVARLTTASVLANLLTVWLVEGPTDLTGALTSPDPRLAAAPGRSAAGDGDQRHAHPGHGWPGGCGGDPRADDVHRGGRGYGVQLPASATRARPGRGDGRAHSRQQRATCSSATCSTRGPRTGCARWWPGPPGSPAGSRTAPGCRHRPAGAAPRRTTATSPAEPMNARAVRMWV